MHFLRQGEPLRLHFEAGKHRAALADAHLRQLAELHKQQHSRLVFEHMMEARRYGSGG